MIRHFGAVWVWPDHPSCTGATHDVEVVVGIVVNFGMAVGVELGQHGLVLGSQVQLIVVFIEWLW